MSQSCRESGPSPSSVCKFLADFELTLAFFPLKIFAKQRWQSDGGWYTCMLAVMSRHETLVLPVFGTRWETAELLFESSSQIIPMRPRAQ